MVFTPQARFLQRNRGSIRGGQLASKNKHFSYLAHINPPYSFQEHIHRYAVWTAARAASRALTGTRNISKAIDAAKLRDYVKGHDTPSDFDD